MPSRRNSSMTSSDTCRRRMSASYISYTRKNAYTPRNAWPERAVRKKHWEQSIILLVPFYHWSVNAQKLMTSNVNSDLMSLGLAQVWLSVSSVAALRARDNFWLDFQGVDHLVFHRLFLFRTVKIPLLLLSLSLVRQVRAFRLCLKKSETWLTADMIKKLIWYGSKSNGN